MKIKNWFLLIFIFVLLLIFSNFVHESIHIIQQKGNVSEVCFVGYDNEGAVGWVVHPAEKNESYYMPTGSFSFEKLWKYSTQKLELIPVLSDFIIVIGGMIISLYLISKHEEIEEENKFLYGAIASII